MRTTLLTAAVLMATPAFGGTFEYKIDNLPGAGAACHQMARDLSARFEETTGIAPLSSECVDISNEGLDFVIRYEADQPLTLVSTARLGLSIYHAEAYTDLESCNADLADQTTRFERATGLAAFVSYCYKNQYSGTADYLWAIRLDGFGEARLRPQLAGTYIFGSPVGHTRDTFANAIVNNLEANGIEEVASVRLHGRGGYTELAILAYAANRLTVEEVTIAKVDTYDQCTAGLAVVDDALVTDEKRPLASYCSAQRIGGYYEVAGVFLGSGERTRTSAERFNSYGECMADRERLTAFYRDELGWDIVGSLCGRATTRDGMLERGWRLIMLKRP